MSDSIVRAKTIKYIPVTIDTVTFTNGAANISSYKPSGMNNFLYALIWHIGVVTGVTENITVYASGDYLVASGNGTAKNVILRYYYTD